MSQEQSYILVAEDDQAYGGVFQRKLEAEGYEVTLTQNGADALAEIEKRMPDLIILDLMMPEKDGFEVLEELREKDILDKTKVIVATNLSQDTDQKKVKEAGADDYFVKSDLSIHEMIGRVKAMLEGGAGESASR